MTRTFVLHAGKDWGRIVSGLIQHLKLLERDKSWQVTVQPYKEDKTSDQRAFFHVLCGVFSSETGYTKDEIKQLCKQVCFGTTEVIIGGREVEVVMASEKAKRDEYSELIETCYRLAAEAGIQLPPPRVIYED
jgi:hypothetical protein